MLNVLMTQIKNLYVTKKKSSGKVDMVVSLINAIYLLEKDVIFKPDGLCSSNNLKGVNFMVWTILSWVMSAAALIGTVINAEQNKYGFAFWIVSNLYMVIRFAFIGEYAQMTLFFFFYLLFIGNTRYLCVE